MATFGDLVVRLGLDKTQFTSGIASSRSALTQLKSLAVPAAAAVAAVGTAFVGAALAFKEFVAPSFESLDTLGDLSMRLGVATDKLAALQHAAGLAGIDQEALTTGVTKFLDTLSNANLGTATAVKAFDALGLKAEALSQLSLDQQFVEVARALQGIQNPADRVRIAIDLFGKSGSQMLQLLNGGANELIASLAEAKALGIAPSSEEVAKIQAANDAIDKMSTAWRGLANVIAVELAPAITNLATQAALVIPLLTLNDNAIASVKAYVAALRGKLFEKNPLTGPRGKAASNMAPAAPSVTAPAAPFDIFGKGKALDSRQFAGAKKFEREPGQLRPSVAPGGMKGAQDTLSRILRAGGHTKDPVVKPAQETAKNTASIAKSIQKFINNGGGGLQIGAAAAGV